MIAKVCIKTKEGYKVLCHRSDGKRWEKVFTDKIDADKYKREKGK